MYLTRIVVDPLHRTIQRCLSDQYRIHQALTGAVQPEMPKSRLLYRVEPDRHDCLVHILVQSAEPPPSWHQEGFAERMPVRMIEGPKRVALALTRGQALHFRLRANPTHKVGKMKSVRTGILTETGQANWLKRRLSRGGFALRGHQIRNEGMTYVRRPEGERMAFVSVLFEGAIEVSDPELAVTTIRNGIGSGKAFGFGLLSVARAL